MRKITLTLNILILFTIGLFFNSCDKSSSKIDEDTTIPYETYLKIKIGGVENPNVARSLLPIFDKKLASTLPISETKSELGVWTDVGFGLDAFTTFDVIEQVHSSEASLKDKIKNNVAKLNDSDISVNKEDFQAATVPLGSNKKYRLLVYDATNTLVNPTNNVFTAGSLATLKVDAGKQYTWIAYSLDETTDPPFNPTTLQLTASELGNKNILYARSSAAVTANYGENLLNIILKHQRVRYDIIIDPRGVFGGMTNGSTIDIGTYTGGTAKTFTTLVNTGNLNLTTGTYSGVTENNSGISVTNMRDTSIGNCTICKVATFHTIKKDPVSASTLAIQFKSLTINYPSSNDPTVYGEDLVAVFTNEAFTPNENNFYRLKATLVPGVQTANGLIWAPTNLYYDGTHKFRASNYFAPQPFQDYFRFLAETPSASAESGNDPCTRVLPLGTWRTPTQAEFASLSNYFDGVVQTTNAFLVLGTTYAQKFRVAESAIDNLSDPLVAEHGKGLYFIYGGYRDRLSSLILLSPLGVELANLGVGAGAMYYWTKTPNGTFNAYYAYSLLLAVLANGSAFSTTTTASLTGKSDGQMIRCVRGSMNP